MVGRMSPVSLQRLEPATAGTSVGEPQPAARDHRADLSTRRRPAAASWQERRVEQEAARKSMKGVRLEKREVESILRTLDAAPRPEHPERRSTRRPYRDRNLVIYREVGEEPIIVVGRNISQHGLAFLFAQYMPVGERLRVLVPDKVNGEWAQHEATVVRCRHVMKMIHEVGIAFSKPLPTDPAQEMEQSDTEPSEPPAPPTLPASANPPSAPTPTV